MTATKMAESLGAVRDPAADWYRLLLGARMDAGAGRPALVSLEQAFQTQRPTWLAHYSAGVMHMQQNDAAALRHLEWCIEHAAAGF